jgi:hypothetical protein
MLVGTSASALADPEHDGSVNLVEYSLGGSPLLADSATRQPVLQTVTGKVRLTVIVRISDLALHFFAETTTDLTDAESWTSAGVDVVTGVDQTGVPSGYARIMYEIPSTGGTHFLRLRFVLN